MKIYSHQHPVQKKNGFIILLTVLIISIVLAISLGIYSLGIREVMFASYLRNSEKAFIAADRALECALYWQRSFPQNGLPYTAFATSTAWVEPINLDTIMECDGQDRYSFTQWDNTTGRTATAGRTFFQITFPDATCADVVVNFSGIQTTIISNGYNNCEVGNPRRTQRTIQVTTNL